jgi:hypothetical protein
MHKIRIACAVALLGTSLLFAQEDIGRTFGLLNGQYWKEIGSEDARSIFITGMIDGWDARKFTEHVSIVDNIYSASGRVTMRDIAVMVSAAYSDRTNVNLPIAWVTMACLAIQKGETTKELVFPALRSHMTAMSQGMHELTEVNPIPVIWKASRPRQ